MAPFPMASVRRSFVIGRRAVGRALPARTLHLLALALVALCASTAAVADPARQPAAPYAIRTTTGVDLVDVTSPLLHFTRHNWRSQSEATTA